MAGNHGGLVTAVTRAGRIAAAVQAAGCPAAPCPWACAPEACAVDRPVNPDSAGPVDDTIVQDEPVDGWDEPDYREWDWADANGGGW